MEWTRVDVQSDAEIESIGGLADLKVGLDTDAESMHRGFLNELPHLSEVMGVHDSLVSEIESRVLSESVSTLGEFVSEFGGEWSESEIRLPLLATNKSEFTIDTTNDDDYQIVRVISPERFGGLIRSFRLPRERRVSEAFWEGEFITIKLD
ncbi:MAG: hypothetical protein ACJZ42_06170 [Candidatus Thalassarchaeaceae archaeon]|jgi:hypothetical protein|nr:MAG: hypothetical protein CND84_02075 [Marine Group II euryarchaeote MED-G35]